MKGGSPSHTPSEFSEGRDIGGPDRSGLSDPPTPHAKHILTWIPAVHSRAKRILDNQCTGDTVSMGSL